MYKSLSLLLPLPLLALTAAADPTLFPGSATFYSPSVGLGSCGIQNQDTDLVAALAQVTMRQYNPSNPNNNPLCGHKIRVWETSNPANTVDVAIEDTCPGCVGQFDLDLSPAAFDRLDRPEVGKIQVEWEFVGEVGVTTGPFAGAVSAAGMNLFLLSTAIEAACCARRRRPLAKKAAL